MPLLSFYVLLLVIPTLPPLSLPTFPHLESFHLHWTVMGGKNLTPLSPFAARLCVPLLSTFFASWIDPRDRGDFNSHHQQQRQ